MKYDIPLAKPQVKLTQKLIECGREPYSSISAVVVEVFDKKPVPKASNISDTSYL